MLAVFDFSDSIFCSSGRLLSSQQSGVDPSAQQQHTVWPKLLGTNPFH